MHVPRWTAQSPDLAQTLTIEARGKRTCVRFAAREHGCFDGVDVRTVEFALSGRHVAYAVRIGAQWSVALDGAIGSLFDGVGRPRFSPDGTRLAFPVESRGKWHVASGTDASSEFDAIVPGL
jgi:hypothetical protein